MLSYDEKYDPAVFSVIAASAAICASDINMMDCAAAVRIGCNGDDYFIANTHTDSKIDLVIAGTKESILMVEAGAKEVSNENMFAALKYGHEKLKELSSFIKEFVDACNIKEKLQIKTHHDSSLINDISNMFGDEIKSVCFNGAKKNNTEINSIFNDFLKRAIDALAGDSKSESDIRGAFTKYKKHLMRSYIIEKDKRIDGRSCNEIRSIDCTLNFLPRTHAVFTRGETQSLCIATLGAPQDAQILDDVVGSVPESFMLHYNFPSYSVCEIGSPRAPGRREIGHGELALKAIKPLIPSQEEFPYVIRIVSEITESNGSSSMATVCGSSLSLMDAGVPMKSHIAGIAMGLIKEGDKVAVLSDIIGMEDALGDMDFKVAGTKSGITALQMDIKISDLNLDIIKKALEQATEGKNYILDKMHDAIPSPRSDLSPHAPKILKMKIHKDKIRELIGQGGKTIKSICESSGGVKIDITDEGAVSIAAPNSTALDAAVQKINKIISPPDVTIDKLYKGKVVKIMRFGLFVAIAHKVEGLLHISELNIRNDDISNRFREGDNIDVKVVSVEPNGKIKLAVWGSMPNDSQSGNRGERRHNNHFNNTDSRPKRDYSQERQGGDRPKRDYSQERQGGGDRPKRDYSQERSDDRPKRDYSQERPDDRAKRPSRHKRFF